MSACARIRRPSSVRSAVHDVQGAGLRGDLRRFRCHATSTTQHLHGEWTGTSASFSRQGEPLQLPEAHVPREYQQWGIELKDWSTLTSITASDEPDAPSIVHIQTRFMLPTVGCEADATSFVEDKRAYAVPEAAPQADPGSAAGEAPARTGVLSCTASQYAAGPAQLPATGKVDLECGALVAPGRRVRLRMPLRKWNEEKPWVAEKLEIIEETYSGPYKGGRELPMSCGAECGFSGDAAVAAETAGRVREAAAALEVSDAWLQASLGATPFVRLPCACAARFCLESDRVALQVAFLFSAGGEGADDNAGVGECLGPDEVAFVSVSVGSTDAFIGQADTAHLPAPVTTPA